MGVPPKNRNVILLATFLIVGALCLRVFVLPVRNALPQQHFSGNVPVQQKTSFPVNPGATIANDTISIEHVPEESAIIVALNPDGRCTKPYLRGRLSGPALVLLEWSFSSLDSITTRTSKMVGKYQVPISGTYFLEIIIITCQDFSHDLDFDFQTTCVEDVRKHRLTESNTKLHIPRNNDKTTMPGFWLHRQPQGGEYDHKSMHTRFQPRGCMRVGDPTHEDFAHPPAHCSEPTSLDRFEPYATFEYNLQEEGRSKWVHLYPSTVDSNTKELLQANQHTKICLVGASHSRTLKASMVQYHNITMARNNIEIEWINVKHPYNVNNKTIATLIVAKCDKIILGVGQWPASFSGNNPTLFQAYKIQFRNMLSRLQFFLGEDVAIFARTIHYNPLSAMISGYCPPKDWRSPPVIDGYNSIIRQACHDVSAESSTSTGKRLPSIQFVDTNFIVAPFWDASVDWGHVCQKASHVEAWYLLAISLGLIDPP